MKRIALTKGQFVIVDDADFELVSQFKWCVMWNKYTRSYYAYRGVWLPGGRQRSILMHRFILGLEYGDGRQGDHINHDTLDQRRANLRILTCQQNQFNLKNAKGYCWCSREKKYRAQIKVNGTTTYLGYYDNPEDARVAYLVAKKKLHHIPNWLEHAPRETQNYVEKYYGN